MKMRLDELRRVVRKELALTYLNGILSEGVVTSSEGKKAIKLEFPRGPGEAVGLVNLVKSLLPKMPGAEKEFDSALQSASQGEYMPLLELLRDYLVMKTKTRVIMPAVA